MDRKTVGIIATVLTALFCGCPGLFTCLFGVLTALGLGTWTSSLGVQEYTGEIPTGSGYVMICVGVVFVLIPILVGIFTLRRKPQPPVEEVPPAA